MKTSSNIFFMAVFLLASIAYGQVGTDPTDPNAIGFSNSSVKKLKWHFAGSSTVSRGLDFYSKFYLQHSASAIYSVGKKDNLSFNLAYTHPFDGNVTFKEDWGLEDLSLWYTKPNSVKLFKNGRTSMRFGLTVPTSKKSQNSSLIGGFRFRLPTAFRWKGNTIVASAGASLFSHSYKTSNEDGTQANSLFILPLSVSFIRPLTRKISASMSLGVSELFDYDFNTKQVHSAGLNLSMNVAKGVNVTGGYSWRDRRLSNNSLFDDDRSSYFLNFSFYK